MNALMSTPRLDGRTALVTGGNSGLGFQTARHLARAGARVLLACRRLESADEAVRLLRQELPDAALYPLHLDLADLDSIKRAAAEVVRQYSEIDLLINNAGVMALRTRGITRQGFELQFGTNHLGHFALTLHLLPLLLKRPGARVVTVSALRHRGGKIDFEDLNSERRYSPWQAYSQSKLANLLFAQELHRRMQARRLQLLSVAAHPGLASTQLFLNGPGLGASSVMRRILKVISGIIGQSAERGAWPQLYAATSPDAVSGGYYGPSGPVELRGVPGNAKLSAQAQDVDTARRLWTVSEKLAGVSLEDSLTKAGGIA